MHRRAIIVLILVALGMLLLGGGAHLVLASLPPQFTVEKCELLRHGMNCQEVAAVLGAPPGDYTGGVAITEGGCNLQEVFEPSKPGVTAEVWSSDKGIIYVRFGSDGKATYIRFDQVIAVHRDGKWQRFKETLRQVLGGK